MLYTFIAEPQNKEIKVSADTEREAHQKAWESLSNDEQDGCSGLDLVEVMLEGQ